MARVERESGVDADTLFVRAGRVLVIWLLVSAALLGALAGYAGIRPGGLDFTALPWQQFLYGLAFMPAVCLLLLLPLAYVIDVGRRRAARRDSRDIREH